MPRDSKRSAGFEVGDKLLLPAEVTAVTEHESGDPELERVILKVSGYDYPITMGAMWLARAIEDRGA